jgi:hypothetical protein
MGSQESAYARMVISYWDMVASFVTNGILNDELLFQSGGELLFTWVRVKPIVEEVRSTMGNPNIFKNLEIVANRFIEFWNRDAPGAFEAFVARMGARPVAQQQKAS